MISVIIPCSGPGRERHLETLIRVLEKQTFQDFRVIVFETVPVGKSNYYDHYRSNILDYHKYFYLDVNRPEGEYNRSWNMNVGATFVKDISLDGHKYLFMDADLVFDENYLQAVNDCMLPWFIAWNEKYNLNPETTEVIMNRGYVEKGWPKTPGGGPAMYCDAGKITCVDKIFYEKVWGGFNENYFGWGLEDNDGAFRASHILGHFPVMPYKIIHLHHPTNVSHPSDVSRDVWWVAEHNPAEISKRLVAANLGQLTGPTVIDISDIKR